jgi:hypothetical protein
MNKELRSIIKAKVRMAIESSQATPEELVLLLEITIEDLIRKFPEKLIENAEKFGVYQELEDET